MIFFRLSRLLREEMVPLKSCGLVIFHRSSAVSSGVGVFELLVYFSMIKRCLQQVLNWRFSVSFSHC